MIRKSLLGVLLSMRKVFIIFALMLLAGLTACGLEDFLPTGVATQDPAVVTAAMRTEVANIVASTEAGQTQVAGMTAAAIAVQTEIANSVASTLTAMVTNTPEFTFTPTFTPSLTPSATRTFTLTPNFPRVTVGADTNCRSGPSVAYNILGLVRAGQTAEIVGQDFDRGHWVIRLPSNPVIICWIWRNSATVTGDANPVPIFTPQPTPTTAINFLLIYDSFTSCGGLYQVKFKIVNNSELTWESNQVNATDRTTNVTTTINRDHFSNYIGCTFAANDTNLAPGENGITTSNTFAANPSGHDFKATIQLCTVEGQSGTCLSKTITFTP